MSELSDGLFPSASSKKLAMSILAFSKKSPDFPAMVEIHQNEFGVTRSTNPKPVLVTYGIVNCVGVAGYSRETGVGFLAHYQHNTDEAIAIGSLLYQLRMATGEQSAAFDVRMKGGLLGMSEHLVDRLRHQLTSPITGIIKFELDGDESELLRPEGGTDLGIDTRTGAIIDSYDPLRNPNHRDPFAKELNDLVFNSPEPRLHYTCNPMPQD